MDNNRFDDLARALAEPQPLVRRKALGLLTAFGLAGFATIDADAKKKKGKGKGKGKGNKGRGTKGGGKSTKTDTGGTCPDRFSPKGCPNPGDNPQYTCKSTLSGPGCGVDSESPPQGSVQVDCNGSEPFCRCNSNGCTVNGVEYDRDEVVACTPVRCDGGCTPKTCADFVGKCGTFDAGCGKTVTCDCDNGEYCRDKTCLECPTSRDCTQGTCGPLMVPEGCPAVTCDCDNGEYCRDKTCLECPTLQDCVSGECGPLDVPAGCPEVVCECTEGECINGTCQDVCVNPEYCTYKCCEGYTCELIEYDPYGRSKCVPTVYVD